MLLSRRFAIVPVLASEELDDQLVGYRESSLCDMQSPLVQAQQSVIQQMCDPSGGGEVLDVEKLLEGLQVQSGPQPKAQHQALGP